MKFLKMHGLGNDFVVLDQRAEPLPLSRKSIQLLCDRRVGIGCDQLILLECPSSSQANACMRIFNADGNEVESCGNASRCVAKILAKEFNQKKVTIETKFCLLHAQIKEDNQVQVNMGKGTAKALKTILNLPFAPLVPPIQVNIGNPHLIFLLESIENVDLQTLGHDLQLSACFAQGTNIELVQQIKPNHLKIRVFERGTGITPACGTGACAAVFAAFTEGITSSKALVDLDGGCLRIEVNPKTHHILMTGPASLTFQGEISSSFAVG